MAAVPPLKELTTASTEPSTAPPATASDETAPAENPEDVMAENAGLAEQEGGNARPRTPILRKRRSSSRRTGR